MEPRKILIVEDEASIVDTLRYALSSEGFICVTANTAGEGLAAVKREALALAVLDIGLPDKSGIELCKEIRAFSAIPILFLTARSDEIDRIVGLEVGGDDYVVKPFSPREVAARVKAILRRGAPQPAAASAPASGPSALFEVDEERFQIRFKGTLLDLSRYEYRLLLVLVRRPGRVFSREQLMALAWESPEMSLERTVDTHIKTIRAKLKAVDPADDHIVTHRGLGYSLKEEA
jgi:two-component system catabolic regulation response regulator CreB